MCVWSDSLDGEGCWYDVGAGEENISFSVGNSGELSRSVALSISLSLGLSSRLPALLLGAGECKVGNNFLTTPFPSSPSSSSLPYSSTEDRETDELDADVDVCTFFLGDGLHGSFSAEEGVVRCELEPSFSAECECERETSCSRSLDGEGECLCFCAQVGDGEGLCLDLIRVGWKDEGGLESERSMIWEVWRDKGGVVALELAGRLRGLVMAVVVCDDEEAALWEILQGFEVGGGRVIVAAAVPFLRVLVDGAFDFATVVVSEVAFSTCLDDLDDLK